MKRLLSSLRWEFVRQYRYGFYFVSAAVIVIDAGLLSQAPHDVLQVLIPVHLVTALIATTFFFMAGMVLLERSEHTLEGLVVSPLKGTEYLAAKMASLVLLAVAESLPLIVIIYGPGFNWLWLITGLVGLSAVYSTIGFVAIARFDSINEFLMPSVGFTILLTLPLVDHLGLWHSPVMYLHPIQPAMVLIRGAFQTMPAWQITYGLVGNALWVAILLSLAHRAFYRFVVRTAGGSA